MQKCKCCFPKRSKDDETSLTTNNQAKVTESDNDDFDNVDKDDNEDSIDVSSNDGSRRLDEDE